MIHLTLKTVEVAVQILLQNRNRQDRPLTAQRFVGIQVLQTDQEGGDVNPGFRVDPDIDNLQCVDFQLGAEGMSHQAGTGAMIRVNSVDIPRFYRLITEFGQSSWCQFPLSN